MNECGKTGKPLMIREARWEETQGDSEDNKKAEREGEEREREDVEEIIGSPSARERGGDPVGLVCDSTQHWQSLSVWCVTPHKADQRSSSLTIKSPWTDQS